MTNLNALLEEVTGLAQTQYDEKKVALISDFDQDMPPLPLDPVGIHQAVLNLLNNALDAVESGKGVVIVRTEFDETALGALISITDNGIGMGPESRRHLFQPFHSTNGLRGTGLGLVVTKKVLDEHGGTIEVESAPAEGTTFTLTLPVTAEQVPALADTQDPEISGP
jgi:signal transduction histidine kinase